MNAYRIRLKSGKVETVRGSSYTIDTNNLLSIYKDREPVAVYAPRAWAWIKSHSA